MPPVAGFIRLHRRLLAALLDERGQALLAKEQLAAAALPADAYVA
jgi:hypothetical protein